MAILDGEDREQFAPVGSPNRRARRRPGSTEQEIRRGSLESGRRGEELFGTGQEALGQAGTAREEFRTSIEQDPLELAGGAQDFLSQSAQGFASDLFPDLQRGLQAARSRFGGRGGGAIRSGGAQAGEEQAFERLFSRPLANRISQLATTSLGFGQSEAQRRTSNLGQLGQMDISRAGLGFDVAAGEQNRFLRGLEGQAGREQETRLAGQARSERRGRGIGSLLGKIGGGLAGFALGGPAGALAGAKAFS